MPLNAEFDYQPLSIEPWPQGAHRRLFAIAVATVAVAIALAVLTVVTVRNQPSKVTCPPRSILSVWAPGSDTQVVTISGVTRQRDGIVDGWYLWDGAEQPVGGRATPDGSGRSVMVEPRRAVMQCGLWPELATTQGGPNL